MLDKTENEPSISTFEKLKEIQYLIKQLSSSREIFKKTKDELYQKAEKQCFELFESKIKIVEKYEHLLELNEESKLSYKFEKNSRQILSEAETYLPNYMFYLRERIDAMFSIIKLANTKEEKTTLASFITNFFYENICSNKFVENEFLILLYLSLKNEINDLTDQSKYQNFLKMNDSFNFYIAKSLLRKDDIKSYFSIIIKDVIENLEKRKENDELILELERIFMLERRNTFGTSSCSNPNVAIKRSDQMTLYSKIDERKTLFESYGFLNELSSSNIKEETKKGDENEFDEKYLKNIFKDDLVKLINEYKEKNNSQGIEQNEVEINKKMIEYLSKQVNEYNQTDNSITDIDNIFTNYNFKIKINESETKNQGIDILTKYKKNFYKIIELIDLLIKNFLNNSRIIPYSVKCTCKLISILIKRKFPDISIVDHNNMIAQFLLENLCKSIFLEPNVNGSFTNEIISNTTRKNLIIVYKIFKDLIFGNLYNSLNGIDSNYTPFNHYFIDKMPKIYEFFDKLIDVKLPKCLDDVINGKVDENNILYDHFKENPTDFMNFNTICCSLKEIVTIHKIIKRNENELINNKEKNKFSHTFTSSFNKIDTYHIRKLESRMNNEIKNKEKNYVLLKKVKYNESLKNVIDILDDDDLKSYESFFELPKAKIQNTMKKEDLNLLKVKNYLSKTLCNFNILNEDILTSNSKTTEEILDCIQIFLQTDYYLVHNNDLSIPQHWYGQSLLTLLKEIPDSYKLNDYEKLFEEIKEFLIKESKKLDFLYLSEIKTKLKYTERAVESNLKALSNIKKIELINQIEKASINVETNCLLKIEMKNNKIVNKISLDTTNTNVEVTNSIINSKAKQLKKGILNIFGGDKNENKPVTNDIEIKYIHEFIRNFPNLVESQKNNAIDVQNYVISTNAGEAIVNFMKFAIDKLKDFEKFKYLNQEEYNSMYQEMNNFILTKINDKIFPNTYEVEDFQIYQRCILLSWVEPKHLGINIPIDQSILNIFINEAKKNMKEFLNQRAAYRKILYLEKIFLLIQHAIVFSTGNKETAADDILPFLEYAVIKCQPKNLHANVKYLNMFINNLDGKFGVFVRNIETIDSKLKDYGAQYLTGVTDMEYRDNCEKEFLKSKI